MKTQIKNTTHFIVIAALFFSASAWAGDISLTTVAEKEITVINSKGEKVISRIKAAEVVPNDEVIYTISAVNNGSESANSLVITDPIPENTSYVDQSASTKDSQVTFSIDGGDHFYEANMLTVMQKNGSARYARADEYTHVRWVLNGALSPDENRSVSFKVFLK